MASIVMETTITISTITAAEINDYRKELRKEEKRRWLTREWMLKRNVAGESPLIQRECFLMIVWIFRILLHFKN